MGALHSILIGIGVILSTILVIRNELLYAICLLNFVIVCLLVEISKQ